MSLPPAPRCAHDAIISIEIRALHCGRVTLYFIAFHDDGVSYVHEVPLFSSEVPAREDEGSDFHETTALLHGLQLSPWTFLWVANEACGVDGDSSMVLPDYLTMPAALEGVVAQAGFLQAAWG